MEAEMKEAIGREKKLCRDEDSKRCVIVPVGLHGSGWQNEARKMQDGVDRKGAAQKIAKWN